MIYIMIKSYNIISFLGYRHFDQYSLPAVHITCHVFALQNTIALLDPADSYTVLILLANIKDNEALIRVTVTKCICSPYVLDHIFLETIEFH